MPTHLITTWRIVWANYAVTAFTGEGSKRASGRWHSRGTSLVYTAESKALAILELMAHLESDDFLKHYRLIPASFDESMVKVLEPHDLPTNWKEYPAPVSTKKVGDLWIRSSESAVLNVPSVIVQGESNFLINPSHADFRKVRIGAPEPFRFDRRLK